VGLNSLRNRIRFSVRDCDEMVRAIIWEGDSICFGQVESRGIFLSFFLGHHSGDFTYARHLDPIHPELA